MVWTALLLGIVGALGGVWLASRKRREDRRCPRCAELALDTEHIAVPASDDMTARQAQVLQRCTACGFATSFSVQAPSQQRRVVGSDSPPHSEVPPGA